MELRKEDLLKIINEQHSEMDEMAGRVEYGYDTKGRSVHDIIKDANGNTIGFKMLDYSGEEPVKIPVLMVCGGVDVVQNILSENPDLISEIKQEFPNHPIMWSAHKKNINDYCLPPRSAQHKLNPLPGEEDTVRPRVANTAKPIEKERDAATNLKIILHKAVNSIVGDKNKEATLRLIECSIPPILGNDIKHVNRNGTWTNDNIFYQTHNVDIYENVEEFIDKAQERAFGGEAVASVQRHMRYRYNNNYDNWTDARTVNVDRAGRKQEYQGKTAVYDVDYLDFSNSQSDASVISELTIKGKRDGDQFNWEVSFEIKFGDALAEGIRGYYNPKIKPSRTLTASASAQIAPGEEFSNKHTVLNSRLVYQALEQALDDLKGQFFTDLQPVDALTLPELNQARLSSGYEGDIALRESLVDKIVDKIMKRK